MFAESSTGFLSHTLPVFAFVCLFWFPAETEQRVDDKEPTVKVLNDSQIYYPAVIKKTDKFSKPAYVVTSTVFDEIPEWKEIKRKGLTENDAEYHLLLKAANKKFNKAIKKVQKDGGWDIIAEKGALECKNCTAEDKSQDVIDSLPK